MIRPFRPAAPADLNLGALLCGPFEPHAFRSPWWLIGGNAQTIIPARLWRFPRIAYRRERWDTPDGDFIDLDWTTHDADAHAPLVVMFHGLEGDSRSHYARLMMDALRARRWPGVVPHFRGCSGEMNRAPRMYHSGDSAEIAWILDRLYRTHCAPHGRRLLAVGISLGGNMLLRYLGERGTGVRHLSAAATVSAPLDMTAGGAALSQGFGLLYTRMFLRTLKQKAATKLDQHPGLYDREAMLAARSFVEFDNLVTAPLHGYRDVYDYWTRASSKPVLRDVRVPALVLNARNDPFLPGHHLPGPDEVSPDVVLDQPLHGGHVGFLQRRDGRLRHMPLAGRIDWMPARLLRFFDDVLGRPPRPDPDEPQEDQEAGHG
ncbi:YheT family hydrolase [Ralstonia solanacearum]|uniref:YheT family hydrolase n=1 Tax=Ralstonia solanacearum TaxID=305 RepID=UPI0001D942D7|nr:YheT family hydrolase [Ralstonia solanacearum]AYB52422.2 YheT family hydrolase [Ralstonia solanacearum]AYB56983.1 YheT family hydrolase [Ralstonia solanacearum]MDB0526006.1 YheT family hydrolase [Ralstonia solanacearum]MDB0565413.1 YheT family hydrolase [Ralstonia solanacearum]MDB0574554.1 YheT family hydrolase [Ralstonia solanacearum]